MRSTAFASACLLSASWLCLAACSSSSKEPLENANQFPANYKDEVLNTLTTTLDSATQGKKDERIYLRADKAVSYGDLMEVMNLLRDAGYLKIALVGLEDTGQGAAQGAGKP